jgi:dTDP-4-dehydrorhamnose reductase
MSKIIVIGSNGQLGSCLMNQKNNAEYEIIFTNRNEIDMADNNSINKIIKEYKPNIVINASAYTDTNAAESDFEMAYLINSSAVQVLADACSKINCLLIHISTDFIFDGLSSKPYKEDDKTNPINVYGKSKLSGENAIKMTNCKYIIIRTSWVFSEYGDNFLKTMINHGAKKTIMSIVDNQIGCPTYAYDLAKTIYTIISKLDLDKPYAETYNYCGDTECSWYQFASSIFYEADKLGFTTPHKVLPINSSNYPRSITVPNYSVLNCSKINNDFSIKQPKLQSGILRSLQKLQKGNI